MDATLITAGALALALLVVVLLLIYLNRRAVKYREAETFPAFESGIHREDFFSQEAPAQTSPAPPPSAAIPGVTESVVEQEPEAAQPHAEAAAPESDTERVILSEDAAFEAAFDAPPKVPSDAGPAWGHPIRRSADPAASLVRNLVEGQGSLSGDELHRMELYRADKLLAAISALEEEFGGKKNENRRKRLQRLRQYAETLQQGPEEWEEAETQEIPTAQPLTTAPGPSPAPSSEPSPGSSEAPGDDQSEKPAAEPELAETAPADTPDTGETAPDAAVESEPLWESWEEESEPTQETELLSENEGAPVYLEEESDEAVYPPSVVGEEETLWPFEAPAEDISTPAAAPDVEVELDGVAQTGEEPVAELVAEEPAPESEAEEPVAEEPVAESAGEAPAEEPEAEEPAPEPVAEGFAPAKEWVIAEDAVAVEEAPPVEDAAPAEEWTVSEEAAAEEAAVAEPLAKDAAPADGLPPLAGLSTEELAGLLASVEDKSIRVAAIDQLVAQPSPEGLQALYQCLEDPDPEIQLHALEAAEKLLARPAAE